MSTDCPNETAEDTTDETVVATCEFTIESEAFDVSVAGDCDSGKVFTIEPKADDETDTECETVTQLMPSDTIQVMRNGACLNISIADLMKQLDCSNKECL